MKKILLLPAIILPLLLCAQVNLKTLSKKSYQAFAYSITAAVAEKYNKLDSIDIDTYLPQTPAFIFNADSVDETKLPIGLYVIVKVVDNKVAAYVTCVSNLLVYPINNLHRVQLLIRSKAGQFITNAHVWVNNKEAVYDTAAKSYRVKQKYPDDAVVKVYAPGDTVYTSLSVEANRHNSVMGQRWRNFKLTRLARTVAWLPNKIAAVFKKSYYQQPYNIGATGTIVLNQPKYKKTDTLKLKAYVFDKKWRRYNKPVYLYLEYYGDRQDTKQLIKILKPASPGSFIAEFPLNDTLKSDEYYTVNLQTKEGLSVLREMFKIEDYVLNEVATCKVRSSKDTYYSADTMHFFAAAADAKGLPLLDATAQLILTTVDIKEFYKDSMYVADTLLVMKNKLVSQGETVFDVPVNILPGASLAIKATLNLSNGNNELQESHVVVNYYPAHRQLVAIVQGDSIKAEYRVNGISILKDGVMKMEGEFDETKNVSFPLVFKIDPLAHTYSFYGKDEKGNTDSAEAIIPWRRSTVKLTRLSKGDTLGFVLNNALKIPVSFTVFDGNKIVGVGNSSDAAIQWQMVVKNKNRLYTVKWQYWWDGGEQRGSETIGLLYKLLNINITDAASVFPGQKDTIRINVSDYKNRPVKNADITAVSYNSQFANSIDVPDPPYLVKYKRRPILVRKEFNTWDDKFNLQKYPLGHHTGWVKNFGLDTLLYYQMLLPAHNYFDAFTHIASSSAQVAVHAVKKGQKQQIYMLYLNRQLAYYSGVTDNMPYAFEVWGGYMQVGMRLYDKFIEIDSIYVQPYYKHDLVFDIDNLPPNAKVYDENNYFSTNEIKLLENDIWQLDDNYNTNDAYVWQGNKVVHLKNNRPHLAGPFYSGDSMHFYIPGNFDIHYKFENGYEYDISKKILRLEKKKIFPETQDKYFLPVVAEPRWALGDTLVAPPAISYSPPKLNLSSLLTLSDQFDFYSNKPGNGNLSLVIPKDTTLQYVILHSNGFYGNNSTLMGETRELKNIPPGVYTLLLVDFNNNASQINNLDIKADTTLCINTAGCVYSDANPLLTGLLNEAAIREDKVKKMIQDAIANQDKWFQNTPAFEPGKGTVTGKVISKKTLLPIAFASVTVKGTNIAAATDVSGIFILHKIKPGICKLVATSVGFSDLELTINVSDENSRPLVITLGDKVSSLDEIVVTGYSAAKRKDLTGTVSKIYGEELSSAANGLTGKVAGLQVITDGQPGAAVEIRIRGITTFNNNSPLVVIDGIVYHAMPANLTPDMISDVTTLKGAEATAIYGSAAANGVIIITTKTKTLRQQFRDYAFWQPQIFTDENGQAKFEVTYPDNTTGWQTYVLGMDKHRRMGKAMTFVKSYKPVMAELSMPQFLIEGDSAQPVGKALNYTSDTYNTTTTFTLNGVQTAQDAITLQPKASVVKQYGIIAPADDTVKASFTLQTATGFKDGEERKIPVFKQGTEETSGSFWVLKNDTTIAFTPTVTGAPVELYAQNNTLDILLDEISHLKTYPYYCMEQTSSKLRGLLMEKRIYESLHKPFTDEKTIGWLLQKLQKAQLYNGGWSWWENGTADINITNYVINALLPLRANTLVATNIRNGLLYLQNQLPQLRRDQLLSTLLTMCEAKHEIDYKPWLQNIHFDSLSTHQQWQYVKIKQLLDEDHSAELKYLLGKAVPGMLGGLHWGEDNYRWYGDANATTTLAFEVLQREKGHDNELNSMIQYFLEQRKQGYWVNTVTSASVVSATLPYLLEQNNNFTQPASIAVSGDTSFTINQFPNKTIIRNPAAKQFGINKTGGGLVYLTAYQRFFNPRPQPVTNNFDLHTSFEKNGRQVAYLTAGEKVNMVIHVNALKEAEYVMIEIPIPAGCTYAQKNQDEWGMHKEFLKNKLVLFAEMLSKGDHIFTIELEPRYNGSYTLNPAKASLMYFPTFYGRNEMKKVVIKE